MISVKNKRFILNRNNPYGFKININHPLVHPKFEAFKHSRHIGKHTMRDELRLEFEELFIRSNYFIKCLEQERAIYGAGYDCIIRQTLGNDFYNEWRKQYA
ncbi:MAG: hypothetical protein K2G22_00735 [Eubacterium sp.]|nr:hypothetical protein [Eubacterium sp.]